MWSSDRGATASPPNNPRGDGARCEALNEEDGPSAAVWDGGSSRPAAGQTRREIVE